MSTAYLKRHLHFTVTSIHTESFTKITYEGYPTGALFVVKENWKQFQCTSIQKWSNKLLYSHSIILHSNYKESRLIFTDLRMRFWHMLRGKIKSQNMNFTVYNSVKYTIFIKN